MADVGDDPQKSVGFSALNIVVWNEASTKLVDKDAYRILAEDTNFRLRSIVHAGRFTYDDVVLLRRSQRKDLTSLIDCNVLLRHKRSSCGLTCADVKSILQRAGVQANYGSDSAHNVEFIDIPSASVCCIDEGTVGLAVQAGSLPLEFSLRESSSTYQDISGRFTSLADTDQQVKERAKEVEAVQAFIKAVATICYKGGRSFSLLTASLSRNPRLQYSVAALVAFFHAMVDKGDDSTLIQRALAIVRSVLRNPNVSLTSDLQTMSSLRQALQTCVLRRGFVERNFQRGSVDSWTLQENAALVFAEFIASVRLYDPSASDACIADLIGLLKSPSQPISAYVGALKIFLFLDGFELSDEALNVIDALKLHSGWYANLFAQSSISDTASVEYLGVWKRLLLKNYQKQKFLFMDALIEARRLDSLLKDYSDGGLLDDAQADPDLLDYLHFERNCTEGLAEAMQCVASASKALLLLTDAMQTHFGPHISGITLPQIEAGITLRREATETMARDVDAEIADVTEEIALLRAELEVRQRHSSEAASKSKFDLLYDLMTADQSDSGVGGADMAGRSPPPLNLPVDSHLTVEAPKVGIEDDEEDTMDSISSSATAQVQQKKRRRARKKVSDVFDVPRRFKMLHQRDIIMVFHSTDARVRIIEHPIPMPALKGKFSQVVAKAMVANGQLKKHRVLSRSTLQKQRNMNLSDKEKTALSGFNKLLLYSGADDVSELFL